MPEWSDILQLITMLFKPSGNATISKLDFTHVTVRNDGSIGCGQ